MNKRPSCTEDVFVREMILHGRPLRAAKVSFPLMATEYLQDAAAFMMDDPDIRHRIDAGIIYFYRDLLADVDIPQLQPVTLQERRELLYKIISGKRKYPVYVRSEQGLAMIMSKAEPAIVNDALVMDRNLEALEYGYAHRYM